MIKLIGNVLVILPSISIIFYCYIKGGYMSAFYAFACVVFITMGTGMAQIDDEKNK